MRCSLKTCVIALVREKTLLWWAFLFPVVMCLLFMGMFSHLDAGYAEATTRLAVVEDANYQGAYGLPETIEAISSPDAGPKVADVTAYDTEDAALAATNAGDVDAYLMVDGDGMPQLHVAARLNGELQPAVLEAVLDSYLHTRNEIAALLERDPQALEDASTVAAFRSDAVRTVRLQATKAAPDGKVRYYFALLGMVAGMGMMLSSQALRRVLPRCSEVGARVAVAGTPRWRILAATILGSWLCEFAVMLAVVAFMRLVCGVDFGSNAPLVMLAVLMSTLTACALGSLIGTFAGLTGGGTPLVSAVSCGLSFFTGLYGAASQQVSDGLEAGMPLLAHANPLWQMTHCFFSLLYYDTLAPFWWSCLMLVTMALAFFCLAALNMRRASHV